ncbi:hypothetical protein BGX34_010236 [Mortierella sp. NVP85]|nr:hypothetical protein BGX34_010236 [Mortierella sp. NVP85]
MTLAIRTRTMNTLGDIRFTTFIASILAGIVVLHHLFAQEPAEYVGPAKETSSDPTSALTKCIPINRPPQLYPASILAGAVVLHHLFARKPYVGPASYTTSLAKCMPIPVLDRLVCILVQNNIDPSKTDYGQSVVRDLTAFLVPLVFLLTVEASRVGNSGFLLACMPFTAVVTCLFGGGTYLLIFFVPLINYSRKRILKASSASSIPLARVYAILVANAIYMVSIIYMFTAGMQESEAYSWALILMGLLWLIYSPLTWLFEVLMEFTQGKIYDVRAHVAEDIKARQLVRDSFLFMAAVNVVLQVWAFCRGGSTPLRHFYRPFPFQDEKYAPAFSLMWDLFGAIGASWLWVLSEMELAYQVFFIPVSVLFPGGALMLFAGRWEHMLMFYSALSHSQ